MSLAHTVSAYNRRRKWVYFLSTMNPKPEARILDVGFSEVEYQEADNFLEKHYPYQERITALGIDTAREFERRYPAVRVVTYDGGHFPFQDGEFDICWSNAVLEHVGGPEKQVAFLREVARVSRHAFVTTPNRHFPFELHTRIPLLHWLPKPWFDRILDRVDMGWAAGDYMSLLTAGDLRRRLGEAGIHDYSLRRNRLAGFTLDFVVTFDGRMPTPGTPDTARADG